MLVGVAMLGLGLSSACAPRNLIFTTYTTVGLDISATDAKPTKAVLGYKRFEGAIVPVDPESRETDSGEAMSVYAAIDLQNSWLKGLDILQVFATGQAADNMAERPSGAKKLIDQIRTIRKDDAARGADTTGGGSGGSQ